MKNTLKAFIMLVLALVSVSFVTAADFSIDRVDVDGITVTGSSKLVDVHRGVTVPITVWVSGNNNISTVYDARIEAYISGYEYGEVEVTSDIFAISENGSYKKTLRLKLPSDLESSKVYDLRVVLTARNQEVSQTFKITVEEDRHLLDVYDVIMNPYNNVQAGQPLFITVRVENMGDNVENSIKVTASIPELGIQASEFIDQLVRQVDEDQAEHFVTKRDAATTGSLMLMIPENAKEGDYKVNVKLNYNRGHDANAYADELGDEKTYTIHVKGAKAQVAVNTVSSLVNVDNTIQSAEAGQGAIYKVSIANLGREAQTFSVEALGVAGWGVTRVDPQNVLVGADKTGEAFVYVSPSENTQEGMKTFSLKVKDQAGNVVAEKALTLNVIGSTSPQEGSFGSFKKVLEVGFVALLAILIILGIVLVAKRLGGKEDSVEGQTYYQ